MTEMNRPDAVVDFLEANRVLFERVGQEQQALLKADGAGIGDPLDEEVSRVLDGREDTGVAARRGPIERGWRTLLQRLVRPLLVVEPAEGIEGALLGRQGRARGATGFPLERLVYPLVRAVNRPEFIGGSIP